MSRRRKHETGAHRKDRARKRLRAAEKRRDLSDEHWQRAVALYRYARSRGVARLIWHHVPRSWARKIRTGRER